HLLRNIQLRRHLRRQLSAAMHQDFLSLQLCEVFEEGRQFCFVVNNISADLDNIQFLHNSYFVSFSISLNTVWAPQTRLEACWVTILLGPSSISSLNSTFLLTGRQCITFALFVNCHLLFFSIHFGSFV